MATPSASPFSLPLQQWKQPTSLRVAQSEGRKRKKDPNDWGDVDEDAESEWSDSALGGTQSSVLVLSPDEVHQYRVAGLSLDKELPGDNFPHAPAIKDRPKKQTRKRILNTLSSLSPPIYPPQSAAQQGSLRLQHLGVLTTILHRCLLQRDYIRAGRAWGLILREEIRGPVDVRTGGRWGIGAEILLRRGRQLADISSGHQDKNEIPESAGNVSRPYFTKKGFDDAKLYYETLIVQHPYRKFSPDSISSLHFYPAMFGLWIYVVQEESKIAREDLNRHHEDLSDDELSENEEISAAFDPAASKKRRQALVAAMRETELEQAQNIAARMDEIIVSPPYTDSHELLELRGMVSLWIADLFVLCIPQKETDGYDSMEDSDSAPGEDLSESLQRKREQRIALEKKGLETAKAKRFFEKAMKRGKGVAHSLEDLHIGEMAAPIEVD